ncbi:MAG: response regulator [Anaerolineae bacterium]|nr:MAG: response regulator [Anaerolineae bacterium]MCL4880502.1 response regulator [Anaerolineae bacterium]
MSEEKAQILIVEDDLDLAEMLNAYFRVQGYEILTATWGEDAVRMALEHKPDLVVLDIRLPDITGYEVCKQIRSNRLTADIPIIFLTEKRDRVDKLTGLELGVVDYITKPFDIQELRLRVRNTLRRAQQSNLLNPITNTAEVALTDERLTLILNQDDEWAMLTMRIQGLDYFREMYGFVAADDVLRAVSLMLNNAVRDAGDESDFIGHLDASSFVMVTSPDRVNSIRERIEVRLQNSLDYFYPLKDRDKLRDTNDESRLQLIIGTLNSKDGDFQGLDELKTALLRAKDEVIS